ncbi:hypothetical protein GLYMA_06G297200v4 [Glycine max]|uniref:Uncharacterized protein n=1 Tax=Glycine max TaxID=3847 RepID=K7KY64_SOYBN|nr:hypothetical protein JHK85_017274 [Glycine max]KAH1128174.1 hypothetical protein GYH30_016642 [Glycine max]KHN41151.1 hypothetical protein glysoja_017195 [Glycine soja]KRH56027.1 hypothetical protein GLYMA_06G297200v4 [Glycine max]
MKTLPNQTNKALKAKSPLLNLWPPRLRRMANTTTKVLQHNTISSLFLENPVLDNTSSS